MNMNESYNLQASKQASKQGVPTHERESKIRMVP